MTTPKQKLLNEIKEKEDHVCIGKNCVECKYLDVLNEELLEVCDDCDGVGTIINEDGYEDKCICAIDITKYE